KALVAGGRRIRPHFARQRCTGRVVPFEVHAETVSVLQTARPGDDEVAAGVDGDAVHPLIIRGGGVDAELGAELRAGRIEALGIPAVTAAVGPGIAPGDHEAAGVHGDHRLPLGAAGGRVHLDFAALGHARGVVALGPNSGVGATDISGPRDDEVAVNVHG